jgi:purine-binding chemotaxis protein CheW
MQSTITPPSTAAQRADVRSGKYLAFHLGKEEFAIQVLRVREIMGIQEVTSVPHTPCHVKGVINLRGKVIPIIDLRLKFNMPELEYTQRTCIIIVQIEHEAAHVLMGVIVDSVSEVLALQTADIEDTPDFGEGISTPYLLGMAKIKGKVKILLDINRVLNTQELEGLDLVLSN